jgi:hypothetical protein
MEGETKGVYVAGPITGYDLMERAGTFARTTAALRRAGYKVVNPFEVHPTGVTWTDALRADLKAMMDCDTIYLLPGWERSSGVRLELNVALSLGFRVIMGGE